MGKKGIGPATRPTGAAAGGRREAPAPPAGKPSTLIDTRVIYCGDCLEQLRALPDACIELVYTDPPFNSNRNYDVFWGETKEKRSFEDRHASTHVHIGSREGSVRWHTN